MVAPNWWNSVEQRWNKSGHIPGDALEQFCGSGRTIRGRQRVPQKDPKRPKTAFFGHKRIWWPPKGTPDPRNGSIKLPRMCPDLFHVYSTLFRHFGATTPPYGTKITILGHLGPFWGPIGAPHKPPLTRETVPLHCPGCALTCSTFIPHCSTSSEPTDPVMAPK